MLTEHDCQLMAQVATNTLLRIVLSFTTICCVLCLPCCLYSLWRVQKSVKLHFNSKCIFLTHNFSMLIHIIVRIVLHGKDLTNYFGSWESGCEILPSRSRCELRFVYKLSQYAIEISPFILTAERFVATFRAHRYENRCKWCGICLMCIHLTLAISMVTLRNAEKTGEEVIYYCWLASTGNRYFLNIPIFFIFSTQLATIPGLLYLLKKNERYGETSLHNSTLTERYQLFENLRTLSKFRIMSIVTWIYVTYNAASSLGVNYILPDLELGNQFASVEIMHCVPLYFLILTFLILREDKRPRSQFEIRVNNYQPHYFDELQKFFDEAFEKINLRRNTKTRPFIHDNHTIGLEKENGDVCMSVSFEVKILNQQNNNTAPIEFHLASGKIKGKCAEDRKSEATISSTVDERDGRQKTLKFIFRTDEMRVKRVDELRWQLQKVIYVEKFAGSSAVFESDNSSVIFSAPLTQKYVCEDRINVTLHSENFDFPILVMFSPEIDVQPYGPKSNFYLCERTRKRTLSDSLQHRSTVFCGVVLALSSIAHIVGHMLRRHFMPHRKELYENLDRVPMNN
ncbi:unnamed protein product [Caenorhabditis sp. 36 PRJEB53466]|nr:unnamed protein product [Caenorhabditis sp. 36 PRJEB53466]